MVNCMSGQSQRSSLATSRESRSQIQIRWEVVLRSGEMGQGQQFEAAFGRPKTLAAELSSCRCDRRILHAVYLFLSTMCKRVDSTKALISPFPSP
jgi:hypothetical protein